MQKEIVWDDALALGAQKKEEKKEEEKKVSLDALFGDFEETEDDVSEVLEEPKEIPLPKNESLLDTIQGEIGEIASRIELNSPISAKRNVARFKDNKFELIGIAPITVIEASDQEIALMQADHILKAGKLSDKDKESLYRFEQENIEAVKSLFGVESVAQLNGISEEEMSKYFRRELKEGAKIMLENVMKEVGISEVSTETINALAEMENPTERDIFKAIIKDLK